MGEPVGASPFVLVLDGFVPGMVVPGEVEVVLGEVDVEVGDVEVVLGGVEVVLGEVVLGEVGLDVVVLGEAAVDRASGREPPPEVVDEVDVCRGPLDDCARFLRIAAAATRATRARPIHSFQGVRRFGGRAPGSFRAVFSADFFAAFAVLAADFLAVRAVFRAVFFTSRARRVACDAADVAASDPAVTAVRPS